MALVVPNQGEQIMLGLITGKVQYSNTTNLVIRLFTNNTTPNEGSNTSSFTEASFPGYSGISLPGNSWTISTNTTSNTTSASYAAVRFILNGTQPSSINVYGYYVTYGANGGVMWADRFPSPPLALINDQDQIEFAPYVELD